MKKYIVKPEYEDSWYGGISTDEWGPIDESEIRRLAREWDVPFEELMEQVEEQEEKA